MRRELTEWICCRSVQCEEGGWERYGRVEVACGIAGCGSPSVADRRGLGLAYGRYTSAIRGGVAGASGRARDVDVIRHDAEWAWAVGLPGLRMRQQ